MFTKTGKKESEKMQKRKTAETTGKVEREGGQKKMRERQNAKSLGAVHTHTHTHTNPYSMEKFGHSKMLCQQSRFVGQSGAMFS